MSAAAAPAAAATAPLVIGRYAVFDEIAAGGMATVHLGRLLGPAGFGRTVAVKRLHAHYLKDEEFITMFMDEARIVARIRHPNVVPMVDVVQGDHGLFLVMEYVHGESLSRLVRSARNAHEPIPPRIVAAIMSGVLLGLHAAHETKGLDGALLNVVHRDVSPQNVIIGTDGSARVLDFGIAKAAGRLQVTREGQIKGKLAYMAPEQIRGQVDRRTDVFAAAVVLWEMLAGKRLHGNAKDVDIVTRIVQGNLPCPSEHAPSITPDIDALVMHALASDPKKRIASARDLALELEKTIGLASPSDVSAWVEHLAHDALAARTKLVTAMELAAGALVPLASDPPPAPFGSTPIDPIAPTGEIPAEFDPPRQSSSHDVPSSSAVFAHAHAAAQQAAVPSRDAQPRRSMNRATWTVAAISSLLALTGVILGVYAVVHRAARTQPSSTVVPRAVASGASAGSSVASAGAAEASAQPVATATSSADERVAATPTPTPSSTGAAAKAAETSARPAATATGPATVATTAPTSASPATASTGASRPATPLPAPITTAKKPALKPACDPPYTLDDVGHRHYKPECMGVD